MFHGLDNASYYRLADNVREFWHGDGGKVKDLIERLVGSAPYFDHDGRTTTSSLNFLTAQDGFILQDKVSYSRKHNLANGEEERDGHSNNKSSNLGVEGQTDDPAINASRTRRKRNMIATLMLS